MSVTDWMTVRVVLLGREGELRDRPPGRVLLARADHTFADLGEAIDIAFGRWDLTPLHEFDVEGRRLPSAEDAAAAEQVTTSDTVQLGEVGLKPGSTFGYVFDLGERWLHTCEVEDVDVDPAAAFGEQPDVCVPVFGWGTIPDQYGREDEDDDEPPEPTWDDAPADELEDEPLWENEDEAAFLAAWDEARGSAWAVVQAAVAPIERTLDQAELARVATALRQHAGDDRSPYDVLWAAAELDDGLPADDLDLWTTMAAAVIEPQGELPIDLEVEAAWAALEPADWAGGVIELTRAGVGQRTDPEDLIGLIARCPEIEGPGFTDEDVETLELAFGPVVELWRVLGVVDDMHRLTPLGHWGLVEALRFAWTQPSD